MNKVIMAAVVCLISGSLHAACMGPYCWDGDNNGSMSGVVFSKTRAVVASSTTINATTSSNVGETMTCNTCNGNSSTSGYEVCLSTTAGVSSAWVFVSSTTKRCN